MASHQTSRKYNDIRVCRISPTFPNSAVPGGGQPGYYATAMLPYETILFTRRQLGQTWSLPRHARLIQIYYPDVELNRFQYRYQRLFALMLKVSGYLIFSLRGLPSLVKFHPQIIHLHTALPIVFGVIGKWVTGSKLVATIHGTELSWIVKSRFLRSMLNHSDAICYVSSSMRPKLEESLTVPIMRHTPSGVDLSIFTCGSGPRDTFILAVGNFRQEKGFDILIKAFGSINCQLPETKLILVGDGPGRPKIEQAVRYYGLEKSVLFKGTCHREEVAKLMREARLLVMSSRSEGEPKVLLESIASGTPVVVTDVGGCQALAQGKGLVVPPEDPDALSTATIRMLTDADLWSSFHEACKTSTNVLGWQRTVVTLEELYESLASMDLSTNP